MTHLPRPTDRFSPSHRLSPSDRLRNTRFLRKARPLALLAALALASSCAASSQEWRHEIGRDHPLTGHILDVAAGRFIAEDELLDRLAAADFVLLGEKHDNADHHRLQARVLKAVLAARSRGKDGGRPKVAFEMIDRGQEAALQGHLSRHPKNADGLGAALDWEKRGWPDWPMYRPIAQAALDAGAGLVPANLEWADIHRLSREGLGPLGSAFTARMGLDSPLPGELAAGLAEEIRESHCNLLPEAMIAPMARIQRARDAIMAAALLEEDGPKEKAMGARVLIAGNGHVRKDRGVPYYLRRLRPGARVSSLGIWEVHPKETAAPSSLPYDFVWFTPRVDLDDPCEKFAPRFKHMKKKPADGE